jgi:GntR family trehalose operon transcriptional repressor
MVMKMKENKYMSIYQNIVKDVKRGEYKPGDKLPSEHELAEHYETSRETIRKSLNLLAQNGYIQKIRGKGSIVLDMTQFNLPISGLVSFKELSKEMSNPPKTKVNELTEMEGNTFLEKVLELSPGEKVWQVVRSRNFDGENVILDKDYFKKSIVEQLTVEICKNSIYEYLEKDLGLIISFAKKEFVVEKCTEEDYAYLDLKGYDHVVVVRNYVYLEDATLFQYTESRHRLDKFQFVDFARREK